MQEAADKFYPGARLLSYYKSHEDANENFMVIVPPFTEEFDYIGAGDWETITEEEVQMLELIEENEGQVLTPIQYDGDHSFVTIEEYNTGELKQISFNEGSLHDWFGKSKSKDGKPGWVQSDGSPCANEKGETKTPKCYSSRRLAGLKKTEEGKKKIRSADARKSRQDSGQQQKSGAAKPTMVRTFTDPKDYKKHSSGDGKNEEYVMEAKDKKGSGSGTKDACYHKVKARFKVWPSAYGSGALVKCRQKGAANWGNSSKKEEYMPEDMSGMSQKSGDKRSTESGAGMTAQGVAKYNRRTGGNLKTAVTTPPSKLKPGSKAANRRKSFCARSRGWTGERGKAARRRWNC
jgi:hypothetical protein